MHLSRSALAGCLLGTSLFLGLSRPVSADTIIDFEDLILAPASFYNGADGAGGFVSQSAFFNNSYDPQFGS